MVFFLCPDETKSKYQNRYFFQRFRIMSEAVFWQNKRENIREPGDRTTGAHGGTNRERKKTAKVKERNLNDESQYDVGTGENSGGGGGPGNMDRCGDGFEA